MPRPTGRVLTLLELLQSGGTRTVAELADRLGVEGRTVRRYVDQLIDLDLPVESVRGRYGGYRLAPGYRLPPLMLSDDEALAVVLGLVAGRRAGLTTAERTAGETASAKIRRVLPRHIARRLDTLLEALAFTEQPGEFDTPDAGILLTIADAVRHHRPVSIRYTDRDGRRSERTLHAYGIVAHAGRWYVTGKDARIDEDRTFRLDRIADARTLPGSFEAPVGPDPEQRVLSGFATAEYRHEVTLRIHGTVEQIRARLPAGVASLEEHESAAGEDRATERWLRVELRVERLDWLPPVLASLDRPFVIERPAELRDLVVALADRLTSCAAGPDREEPMS
ncbi:MULTISPECIES: helix-turn-helix transcriptional regulator [Streptomyces]|uniref:Transcriptional regulator n=1 Tax=Streptomyces virginiae TaxID=1961 RepID=A0ABQ3NLM3_STRVG|nr:MULTISPECIES: YafY family protein [Streptomyces]KOU93426.1 transcriptional regulator [Streptomyces sp. XY593]KOV06887.1 transcriptional regulator [Streptomyces sp. XY533]KOV10534.1 transcriptional regulator [Streptomyces sp. XY511]MBP2342454.1 putative DNA-binding transcriptional regulator YafY [Streptomyces virginiae]MCI4079903.1 YafY family transcriptional regulator [Streptomyces sp. MMS21 TC-5]